LFNRHVLFSGKNVTAAAIWKWTQKGNYTGMGSEMNQAQEKKNSKNRELKI